MLDNTKILKAAKRLADEQPHLLGDDAKQITQWLDQTPEDDPEAIRQTANRLLDKLQQHPEAWQAIHEDIGTDEEVGVATRLGYHNNELAGDRISPIPAGTKMVCPEAGCDYRRSLRQKGQRLVCPDHGLELVPEPHSS